MQSPEKKKIKKKKKKKRQSLKTGDADIWDFSKTSIKLQAFHKITLIDEKKFLSKHNFRPWYNKKENTSV